MLVTRLRPTRCGSRRTRPDAVLGEHRHPTKSYSLTRATPSTQTRLCSEYPISRNVPRTSRNPPGPHFTPPGLDASDPTTTDQMRLSENMTRCRSRRTRAPDQILPSHQGDPEYSDQIVLRAPYLGECAAHLLLQHVTLPPAAIYSDRGCPCRHRRRPPCYPLYRVRDAWHQFIGPITPASLRPNHSSGALGSRPDRVAPREAPINRE
ncbi:hypothetical protein TIFTF001_025803 [Ficus carica]|uniref:Uncharacterized protein n=1 Tax=Ficus carica TaxID=3494 RepID=A0AA88AKH9_FICCA|nr:hypothetical protein TIFTF001_025803 [Ficus carica]